MRSMTSYAKKEIKLEWGQATWELRSVNHRYFDAAFKMHDSFRGWEPAWRTLLNQFIHRGKVECNLYFRPSSSIASELNLNIDLIHQLKSAGQMISTILPTTKEWSIKDVLQWPNVIQPMEIPTQILEVPLTELLTATLEDFVDTRAREGKAIYHLIDSRLAEMTEQINLVKAHLPEIISAYREKMMKRMSELELKESFDSNRFEQEMVYFIQRSDVAEEVDRLSSHIVEVKRVMQNSENIGRRLDFLMQEMNREANTLASKSCYEVMTQCALELKVLIEKMREQIQNVE